MSARILYDSPEDIPDNIRDRAVKTANGFEVDAKPLLDNHAQVLRDLQRFRAAADKFDGIDAVAARNALQEVARLQQQDRDTAKAVDAVKKNADREREDLLQYISGEAITSAIARHGGNAMLLRPHVAGLVRSDYHNGNVSFSVLDDEYHTVRKDGLTGRPVTVDELVMEMKRNPTFSAAFTSTTTSSAPATTVEAGPQYFQPASDKIRLTREQAKDVSLFREALAKVGGRFDLIEFPTT